MHLTRKWRPVLVLLTGLAVAASSHHANAAATSFADALSVQLGSGGTATPVRPVAPSLASTANGHPQQSSGSDFEQTIGVGSAGTLIGTLALAANTMATGASATLVGKTTQLQSQSMLGTVGATLSALGGTSPLLSVSATTVAAVTNWSQTGTGAATLSGGASFGSLLISGSLVGSHTVTFSGAAAPNTVVYSDAHTVITLNAQTQEGSFACAPTCVFVPHALQSAAIVVQFTAAPVGGKRLNGDIAIGQTQATGN